MPVLEKTDLSEQDNTIELLPALGDAALSIITRAALRIGDRLEPAETMGASIAGVGDLSAVTFPMLLPFSPYLPSA